MRLKGLHNSLMTERNRESCDSSVLIRVEPVKKVCLNTDRHIHKPVLFANNYSIESAAESITANERQSIGNHILRNKGLFSSVSHQFTKANYLKKNSFKSTSSIQSSFDQSQLPSVLIKQRHVLLKEKLQTSKQSTTLWDYRQS